MVTDSIDKVSLVPAKTDQAQLGLWLILVLSIQLVYLSPSLLYQQTESKIHERLHEQKSTEQDRGADLASSEAVSATAVSKPGMNSIEEPMGPGRPDIVARKGTLTEQAGKAGSSVSEVIPMSTDQILNTHQFFPLYERLTELGRTGLATLPPDLVANPVTRFSSVAFVQPMDNASPYVVTLDPGHGGVDPGAIGTHGELEKYLTLDITRRVARLLESSPLLSVRTTRDGDTGYSRSGRVKKIKSLDSDLLVSLHFNHLPQSEVTLVETFYAGTENILESLLARHSTSPQKKVSASRDSILDMKLLSYPKHSQRIADILQSRIYGVVSRHNPEAIDAGVKKDTLYILTQSRTPGALIELTCLSNSAEEKRLQTTAYREELASAIAGGLLDYFENYERASGI